MSNLVMGTPLRGQQLIEASAGTGKTYTIALLYLRALLGMGTHDNTRLDIAKILVVTFTNAATEELRDRIRMRISEALDAVRGYKAADEMLQEVLDAAAGTMSQDKLENVLAIALANIDRAEISTIHSFATRLVKQTAFAGGLPLNAEVVIDNSILDTPIKDAWRTMQYRLACSNGHGNGSGEGHEDENVPDTLIDSWSGFYSTMGTLIKRHGVTLANLQTLVDAKALSAFDAGEIESRLLAWNKEEVFAKSKFKTNQISKAVKVVSSFIHGDGLMAVADISKLGIDYLNQVIAEKSGSNGKPFLDAKNKDNTFFVQCQALIDEYGEKATLLNREIAEAEKKGLEDFTGLARSSLIRSENNSGAISADRILQLAANATSNHAMAAAIRELYPLAMIDEFQDTDTVQYSIFANAYSGDQAVASGVGLLMIGDPKQAIYSFRGGDIYTYFKARERADEKHNMDRNFRSTAPMVAVANGVFSQVEGHQPVKPPFQNEALAYEKVFAGAGNIKPLQLKTGKTKPLEAVSATFNAFDSDGAVPGIDELRVNAAVAAAQYVKTLLQLGEKEQLLLPSKDDPACTTAVQASDIAILVRGHAQGGLMKQALIACGVPVVDRSKISIFAQPEAIGVWRLLMAIQEPHVDHYLNPALLSEALAYDLPEALDILQNESKKQFVLDALVNARLLLNRSGPLPATMTLLEALGRFESLSGSGGERGLTNLLHVLELVQEQYSIIGSGLQLNRWLGEKVQGAGDDDEDNLIRLESDANRVQIVTIHSSKGLEYPVVLLPFAWESMDSGRNSKPYIFHNDEGKLCAGFGVEEKVRSGQESIEEGLRLFYVALTRASRHLWLYFTDTFTSRSQTLSGAYNQSALGYYFPTSNEDESVKKSFDHFKKVMKGIQKEFDDLGARLPVYGENIEGQMDYKSLSVTKEEPGVLTAQGFDTNIRYGDRRFAKTSFTALNRGLGSVTSADALKDQDDDEVHRAQVTKNKSHDRFALAAGAHIGNAMHDVLENLPFDTFKYEDNEELERRLKKSLWHYGVLSSEEQEKRELPAYLTWLQELLDTPYHQGKTLKDLKQWIPEMEFALSLPVSLTSAGLNTLLQEYDTGLPAFDFNQLRGLLTGAIDLVFQEGDKFYVADYKSSYMGDTFANYAPEKLTLKNIISGYTLQYLIYALALHRYLKSRRGSSYDYESHFGGVYYLYLRGMHPDYPDAGVFFTKPDKNLLNALDKLFSGEELLS